MDQKSSDFKAKLAIGISLFTATVAVFSIVWMASSLASQTKVAFDLRSWVFKEPKLIEMKINQAWEYDPKRPEKNVAWFHEASPGSGNHFHIQVHPRTQRRT